MQTISKLSSFIYTVQVKSTFATCFFTVWLQHAWLCIARSSEGAHLRRRESIDQHLKPKQEVVSIVGRVVPLVGRWSG